ncbi:MAG TPA: PLP-dependent transferase [Candidatus Merdenecus merdavium]|nr:PLP-dependent transferase [Candidatus Merdenecus merdavium]
MREDTRAVHGDKGYDKYTGAISYPLYMSATFAHPEVGKSTGYDYSRLQNPTREEVEETIKYLEHGCAGLAYSSGMAAITAIFAVLPARSHILLSEDLYGGTPRLANEYFADHLEIEYVDTTDLELVKSKIKDNTKALFIETPSNPMMLVSDIAALADLIHQNQGYLIVDNTFLTPILQKPLDLGADVVVHSGTKYLCGHNDVIAGFIVVGDRQELIEALKQHYKSTGAILSPFDSWLMIRSMKTLSIRVKKQQENAEKLVDFLKNHKNVTKVYYVGMEDHPGYDLNKKQAAGAGAMISFKVRDAKKAKDVLKKIKLIYFAESLGGVESLMTYPLLQTHAEAPKELTQKVGIDDTLLRMSVGIEDLEDLIQDLQQALDD